MARHLSQDVIALLQIWRGHKEMSPTGTWSTQSVNRRQRGEKHNSLVASCQPDPKQSGALFSSRNPQLCLTCFTRISSFNMFCFSAPVTTFLLFRESAFTGENHDIWYGPRRDRPNLLSNFSFRKWTFRWSLADSIPMLCLLHSTSHLNQSTQRVKKQQSSALQVLWLGQLKVNKVNFSAFFKVNETSTNHISRWYHERLQRN